MMMAVRERKKWEMREGRHWSGVEGVMTSLLVVIASDFWPFQLAEAWVAPGQMLSSPTLPEAHQRFRCRLRRHRPPQVLPLLSVCSLAVRLLLLPEEYRWILLAAKLGLQRNERRGYDLGPMTPVKCLESWDESEYKANSSWMGPMQAPHGSGRLVRLAYGESSY
jgi:hypothetical protein